MSYLLHQELFAVVEPLVRNDQDAHEVVGRAVARLMAQEKCFRTCGNACEALNHDLLQTFIEWYDEHTKGTPT